LVLLWLFSGKTAVSEYLLLSQFIQISLTLPVLVHAADGGRGVATQVGYSECVCKALRGRHRRVLLDGGVASTVGCLLIRIVDVVTKVDGPVMLNEERSSRIWLRNCND
jgi:hypothetical protein